MRIQLFQKDSRGLQLVTNIINRTREREIESDMIKHENSTKYIGKSVDFPLFDFG